MDKLKCNGTNFVRCIKPNNKMIDGQMDGSLSLMQLKCSGMSSVLELMEYGFPSKVAFGDLYNMYKDYLPKELKQLHPKTFCEAMLKSLKLSEKEFKFGITMVFFRPGKYAEFDKIMKSNPENLKAIVSDVKKLLVKLRWIKTQFCALTVIKMKNKIAYRRQSLITMQKVVRGYLVRKKHGPRIVALRNILELNENLRKIELSAAQLKKDRDVVEKELNNLKQLFQSASERIKKDDGIDANTIAGLYKDLVLKVDQQMSLLQRKLQDQKIAEEQERLRKIQEEMERQKKLKEEEEQRMKEEEENRRLKAEMEARRKIEEDARKKQEEIDKKAALELQQQQIRLAQEERYFQEQLEQERQDRELAMRLAQETNGQLEESPPMTRNGGVDPARHSFKLNRSEAVRNQQANMAKGKHDLSKWKYSELRDTINTSCDIELLEACRHEFHRRLKVYHAWKAKNRKRTTMEENERAPRSVMESAARTPRLPQKTVLDNVSQRFFRIPFQRPSPEQQKGWWYAHFDGQYVARQMELHADKPPILLVAGTDDMQMCELSLEETGLTRKRGAEILESEFNKEWEKNGGGAYTRPADRK